MREKYGFLVDYRPGMGEEGGPRVISIGPAVVLATILEKTLARWDVFICGAAILKFTWMRARKEPQTDRPRGWGGGGGGRGARASLMVNL